MRDFSQPASKIFFTIEESWKVWKARCSGKPEIGKLLVLSQLGKLRPNTKTKEDKKKTTSNQS